MRSAPARISVVVIGRNEGDRLVRCLEAVKRADYPQEAVELIYVDTDSTDRSCDAARALGARVVEIHPTRPSAATARNAGMRAATHDLIHFFDGDTLVDRAWFARAVAAIDQPDVACVFGRRTEVAPNATIFNFWAHHDWYVPPGPAESCAGDALFRKDVLERLGGFDETLIAGEEPDLCHRIRSELGLTILSVDAPMTLHDMNMTRWGQYWRRCVRTGHAYAVVGARHKRLHRWRAARWRNLVYGLGTPACLIASLFLRTPWPAVVWMGLVAAAWLRNGWRMRARVGGLMPSLRYSAHHYIAKTPMAVGQLMHWWRLLTRSEPRPLIEYRG